MKTFKKLGLIATIAIATIFSSCTPTDDNPQSAQSSILPKKIVSTFSGGQVRTSTFTYAGNKIVEELIVPSSDISKKKYTYTGDNITKIEYFATSTFSAAGGFNFTYENGKLKTSITIAEAGYSGDSLKEIYTYNADGTVTSTSSFVNQTTGAESAIGRQMRFTYSSGHIIKSEQISGGVVGQVTNFTFEAGKNQAFKNVTGFDQTLAEGNLRLTSSFVGISNANRTYTYSFNSDNYPSQVVEPNASGSQSKTQVFTY
jgi:hypothetical protein